MVRGAHPKLQPSWCQTEGSRRKLHAQAEQAAGGQHTTLRQPASHALILPAASAQIGNLSLQLIMTLPTQPFMHRQRQQKRCDQPCTNQACCHVLPCMLPLLDTPWSLAPPPNASCPPSTPPPHAPSCVLSSKLLAACALLYQSRVCTATTSPRKAASVQAHSHHRPLNNLLPSRLTGTTGPWTTCFSPGSQQPPGP
jgi:hypothetical protein